MIDPIAVRLGPIQIHWYGIAIATAALAGALLASAEARRRGENPDHAWGLLLWTLVFGIAGARLYHVIHMWSYYSQHFDLIPQIWRGGLGIPGAIAAGAVTVWVYARVNRISPLRWLDIAAPAMLLAQAIGRFGNFVNQELYGPPTTLPWGIPIDAAHQILYPNAAPGTRFHPLFAYEALLNLIGMALILYVGRRFARRLYDGDIVLLYFVWYGAVRSGLEWMRTDNWFIGPLPAAVWLGVLAMIGAAALLVLRHVKGWGTPGAWHDREGAMPGDDTAPAPAEPTRQPG
ncbi:MAG: prolipoprotein diacylglyceryl transferase [Candidatus Limnocylindria bacterium]